MQSEIRKAVFFIFNLWGLSVKTKDLLASTVVQEPCTRPPSCTTPRQPTIYHFN